MLDLKKGVTAHAHSRLKTSGVCAVCGIFICGGQGSMIARQHVFGKKSVHLAGLTQVIQQLSSIPHDGYIVSGISGAGLSVLIVR